VALLLQSCNNTAALTDAKNQTETPLPANIDNNMLTYSYLNDTVGSAVPLVDGAAEVSLESGTTMMGFVWIIWCLYSLLL
jgi:hypothetical protein